MPLNHEYVDKWGKSHPEAWSYCAHASFSFEDKAARLEFWTYTSKLDAYAGRPPIATHTINVTPEGTPAVMSSVELITAGVPAVYGDPDPETGEVTLVTPAVDPVYSEPSVVRPAVPFFGEVLVANSEAYSSLEASLAGLATQVLPELANAMWEPVTPVA